MSTAATVRMLCWPYTFLEYLAHVEFCYGLSVADYSRRQHGHGMELIAMVTP
jgi:hypothetical protein